MQHRTMNRRMRWRVSAAVALIALLAGAAAHGTAYVELPDGTRVEGSAIRARPDGEIILTTPLGIRNFAPGRYVRAVAEMPAEFDRARRLLAERQFDEALPLLAQVVREYRFLDWDLRAQRFIARVHEAREQFAEAVQAYERLFEMNSREDESSEVRWGYKNALVRARRFDQVAPLLEEHIRSGDRENAARAQVLRGDLRLAQGNQEEALLDYLRTVILFEAQRQQRPRALLKAAQVLQQRRDARASELLGRLVREFPESPEAARARDMM